MRTPRPQPYKLFMTLITDHPTAQLISTIDSSGIDPPSVNPLAPDVQAGPAARFLGWLAAGDFGAPNPSLDPAVTLKALLPPGSREWTGRESVSAAFESFFGGMDAFEVVGVATDQVADRLSLRWRVHASGGRLGSGQYVAEQTCYAALNPNGRIAEMSLVCSGFRPLSATP